VSAATVTDPHPAPIPADEEWRGDFGAAEKRRLELSLAATPSERLMWLEEALRFAARMRSQHQE
jgi:hypothetical protein